jgi:hypothetical protein
VCVYRGDQFSSHTRTHGQVEKFYEDTTTDLGQQLGFLKSQLRGDGNKGSQLALEDMSEWWEERAGCGGRGGYLWCDWDGMAC